MGQDILQFNVTETLPFLMVRATDHVTPMVGLIDGISLTITISKNGAIFAAPAGAVTEIGSGWYGLAPNAVDADTEGPLIVHAIGPVRLTLAAVAVGNSVTINGLVFTAAGAPNLPLQIFDQSGDNTADALSLAAAINHPAAQVLFLAGGLTVLATPTLAVVTLCIGGIAADTLAVTSAGGTITVLTLCDLTDETFDVKPAFAAPVPGAGTGGPVEARSSLTLPQVKLFLRVTGAAEDGLIGALLTGAKQAADSFLCNPFRERIPTLTFTGVVVGDQVEIDGRTYTAAAAPAPEDQEFGIGATDHDTAVLLAALLNSDIYDEDDEPYGVSEYATALVVGDVLTLVPKLGKSPLKAESNGGHIACTRVMTDTAIPDAVNGGVLRMIARLYEQRADQVGSESVSGLGSVGWNAPSEALILWQPYLVPRL